MTLTRNQITVGIAGDQLRREIPKQLPKKVCRVNLPKELIEGRVEGEILQIENPKGELTFRLSNCFYIPRK
ncbi:MAG: hypothetical protein KJ600_06450 [Nanoarchaeota archaeon]|nr:hypothetical protein [Nanoarchaeota archaeon]MBU1104165.1 hypothetical protein [Nanoarchaeota archaeon]